MSKIALIIGRFQPIHLGHLSLIERYHRAGFFIKIGVGSSNVICDKHNPLSAIERIAMLKLTMQELGIKKYKIFLIPDTKNDDHFVKHVLRIVGNFNIIITGNPSILKLFSSYEHSSPWNIESFKESVSRPGGNITSGIIRKMWLEKPNKNGLLNSTFAYLKNINFSERLNNL